MSKYKTYFTAKPILSLKALINLVLSNRSDGKTFNCKQRILDDFADKGWVSIYMRRFKTELTQESIDTFFDKVIDLPENEKYRGWKFRGNKKRMEVDVGDGKWQVICYFVVLTMSAKLKSTFDETKIHVINFDEYIPVDGRYAFGEMDLLMEFYKTIDRDRDTTQLIILGNKITPFCPILDYFNIDISIEKGKIRTYRKGTIAVQIYVSSEHEEERNKNRFAELVKDTPYDEYAHGGVLHALNIKTKSREGATYYSSFKTSKGSGTIWYDDNDFIISTYKRQDGFVLCDKIYNTGREEYDITYGKFASVFKKMYKSGKLCFENEKAFNAFSDILRRIGGV